MCNKRREKKSIDLVECADSCTCRKKADDLTEAEIKRRIRQDCQVGFWLWLVVGLVILVVAFLYVYLFGLAWGSPWGVKVYLLSYAGALGVVATIGAALRFQAHGRDTYGWKAVDRLGKAYAFLAAGLTIAGTIGGIFAAINGTGGA